MSNKVLEWYSIVGVLGASYNNANGAFHDPHNPAMDAMNMTSMDNRDGMAMLPFHTAVGFDALWFPSWMPGSPASTLGACVGLFFLAGSYRFLFALRAIADLKWTLEKNKRTKNQSNDCCQELNLRPPFSLKFDLLRGLLEGVTSFVGYFLMLAVMVMNAWFFIAIILGIVVGETAFGRFASLGIEMHGLH